MGRLWWLRPLTEAERSDMLDDQLERFARDGWRVVRRSPTTAVITRPKRFSVGTAIFSALFLLIGLVIYLVVFAARRDPISRLIVGEDGRVHGDWSDGSEYWPELPGDWVCQWCDYRNSDQRAACRRCGSGRPAAR
jgi:hypothetical protein